MASPVEINILLHYYYSPDDWPTPWSDAHGEAIRRFNKMGLLSLNPNAGSNYILSDGGQLYVKTLMAVPFPQKVVMWQITPETTIK